MADHISWGSERLCDDCGLPIPVCNARAMINSAMERGHSLESIVPQVGLLQAQVDGLTKERDMCQNFFRSCLNGNHALREKTQQAVQERDAALAREGAVAMEGPITEAQTHIDGLLVAQIIRDAQRGFRDIYPHHVFALGVGPIQSMLGLAVMNGHIIPTDAAAALTQREDEVIEECAVHIETVWGNEIADDLRRVLKRSRKETQ